MTYRINIYGNGFDILCESSYKLLIDSYIEDAYQANQNCDQKTIYIQMLITLNEI